MLQPLDHLARRRGVFVVGVLVAEAVIAAPFSIGSAQTVRGVPGPLLVALALVAAFASGPVSGVVVMRAAMLLGAA